MPRPLTAILVTLGAPALAASPLKDHQDFRFTLPAAEARLAVSDVTPDTDRLVASPAFSRAMNAAARTLTGKTCDPQTLSSIHNESPNLAGLLESLQIQASMTEKPATSQYARLANGYYTLRTQPGFNASLGLWVLIGKSAAFLSCQLK